MPPVAGRRPCRPSPGSRRVAARPSRPAASTRVGEVGVLGEEPEAGMDGVGAGWHARPRRRRRRRGGRARPGRRSRARPPGSRADRTCARCAARSRRDSRRTGFGSPIGDSVACGPMRMNASNASNATRHRPPTRLAGSTPRSIHRWTVRVDVPRRLATSLGASSSVMPVAIVAVRSADDQLDSQRWADRFSVSGPDDDDVADQCPVRLAKYRRPGVSDRSARPDSRLLRAAVEASAGPGRRRPSSKKSPRTQAMIDRRSSATGRRHADA